MCDGEISGAVSIRKAGEVSHVTVPATKVSEVRCVGCDPVPGDPHSCDDACQRAFRPFIELGGHGASLPGDYALTGEKLVLSCAPHRLRIQPLYVSVDAEGNVSGSAEPPAPQQVAVPAPATPARAQDGTTATDIRTLVAKLSRPDTGQAEDLLGQAGDPRGATLDVPATLADARARWTAYLETTTTEVDAALAVADQGTAGRPYGRERTSHDDGFAPAWIPASMTLVVRTARRVTRESERKVLEQSCPRNRPGPCRTVTVPAVRAYHADVALELEYDRTGKLIEERRYPPHPVSPQ